MPQKTKAAERRKGKRVFPDLFAIIRAAVSVLLLILAYSVSMLDIDSFASDLRI